MNVQNLEINITLLEEEIKTLKEDHAIQIQQQQNMIENLQSSITLKQKELRDILDGADQRDISTQQNRIRQAQLSLERLRDQKDDLQIIAEFD